MNAAGEKEAFDCDMTGKTLDDLKCEKKTWESPPWTRSRLEFHTAMAQSANPFGDSLLDDVKVVAVD
jgi:hypothetical protein